MTSKRRQQSRTVHSTEGLQKSDAKVFNAATRNEGCGPVAMLAAKKVHVFFCWACTAYSQQKHQFREVTAAIHIHATRHIGKHTVWRSPH